MCYFACWCGFDPNGTLKMLLSKLLYCTLKMY